MTDITATVSRVTLKVWIVLLILLFLGLTLAVAESMRIERTELALAADDGRLLVTDAGQGLLAGHRCRLVAGSYRVPFSWSC